MPRIWVCTAPATPIVHKSELDIFIVGVIADGGGDLRVVVDLEVTSLVVVESVVIVSSCATTIPDSADRISKTFKFFIRTYLIDFPYYIASRIFCQDLFLRGLAWLGWPDNIIYRIYR